MKRILLFVLGSCMLIGSYAQGDTDDRETYTISGGILGAINSTKFRVSGENSSDKKYDSKIGWSAGGWVNFPLSDAFSIEPQLTYSSYRYFTDYPSALLLNDGKINYISLPLFLKFHLSDKIAIVAGPQVDFLSSVKDNRNVVTETGFNKTSFSLFGGLEVLSHKRVSIFARYVHGMSDMNDGAGHTSAAFQYKNSVIQLGLKLRLFGSTKKAEPVYQATSEPPVRLDRDGDGIFDDEDKCPDVAGLAKYNGCPIPDSDGDGINDELDKCPKVAGLAKYDGCPIPDSDGDGINDEEDKCPNQPGTAKYNGCPVPDKDGDGINDELDRCPDIAGIAANNGCPEVPANVSKALGTAAMSISFGTGTNNTALTTKGKAALDRIVTIMNENPGLMIKVESHTDNAGDEDDNEDLSEARAKAVKDYLVSKGIDEDRIKAEGFGESMPIADNNTAAGRAKNRRTEIKIAY